LLSVQKNGAAGLTLARRWLPPGLEVLGSDYEALADIAVSAARAGESV
jgi:hypothetical protein